MTWIWLILLIIIVPTLYLFFDNRNKKKETSNEPNFIHVFPDYPRSYPCVKKAGETMSFIVKGYNDKECMKEVELKKEDIIWQHQNFVGKFVKQAANVIYYQIPEEKDKIGKVSYISAAYHKLKDATWIRIAS